MIDFEVFKSELQGKPVVIWGAGNQGRGFCKVLQRNNVIVEAFVDSSITLSGTEILGVPVVYSQDFLKKSDTRNVFVVISTFYYVEDISSQLINAGFKLASDFISYSEIKPVDITIEVSGTCNLKCISCPRASREFGSGHASNQMSLDDFKTVLNKVVADNPFLGNVQLYQWGEPLLNKKLPDMIKYAESVGVKCALSSNMNSSVDYDVVMKSQPGWFRISVSGTGENYEQTHTGGKWEVFNKNFDRFCGSWKQFNPEMKVEMYYHIYSHNDEEQFAEIKSRCELHGIEFHPVYAYLISLDDVLRHLEGGTFTEQALKAKNLMLLDLDKGLELAKSEKKKPCLTQRCLSINSDLSVSNCMMYFYKEDNVLAENYLETDQDTILVKRKKSNLCKRCMKHGLHRYCSVYAQSELLRVDNK